MCKYKHNHLDLPLITNRHIVLLISFLQKNIDIVCILLVVYLVQNWFCIIISKWNYSIAFNYPCPFALVLILVLWRNLNCCHLIKIILLKTRFIIWHKTYRIQGTWSNGNPDHLCGERNCVYLQKLLHLYEYRNDGKFAINLGQPNLFHLMFFTVRDNETWTRNIHGSWKFRFFNISNIWRVYNYSSF